MAALNKEAAFYVLKIPSDRVFNTSARVSLALRGQISIYVMQTGQPSILKALATAGGGGGVEPTLVCAVKKKKGGRKNNSKSLCWSGNWLT